LFGQEVYPYFLQFVECNQTRHHYGKGNDIYINGQNNTNENDRTNRKKPRDAEKVKVIKQKYFVYVLLYCFVYYGDKDN